MATPKSGVWQRLVGAPAVAAYGLLGGMVKTLITESFQDNVVITLLDTVLGWVSLALFVIGGLVWVFRATTDVTIRHPPAAELAEPGGPWPLTRAPETVADLHDTTAAVLRELPQYDVEVGVLHGVLDAIAAAHTRLPERTVLGVADTGTATAAFERLVRAQVLVMIGPGRCRLARVPRDPGRDAVLVTAAWRAALAELARRTAALATAWAAALDVPQTAATARRWFGDEEPRLRALVHECATRDAVRRVYSVVPDLAAIADALDTWYARTGLGENSFRIADDLLRIAAGGGYPLIIELAEIRKNPIPPRPRRYRPRALSASLRARAEHRIALHQLSAPTPDLRDVANRLEAAWWLLPREDVAAEACALVDLAIVHIRQGRLDAARDRLDLARSLAGNGRDPTGLAHTDEIAGILAWTAGDPRRAMREWQAALHGWRALDDALGIARCLQHLGSAVVTDPGLGAAVLDLGENATQAAIVREASGWLAHAVSSHPAALHAQEYLNRASVMITDPRTSIGRWPLPPPRPAAESTPDTTDSRR